MNEHIFGYFSIWQLINESLPKAKIFFTLLILIISKILNFIFFNELAIIILLVVMLLDWVLGTVNAIKNNEFESKKFQRMIYKISLAMFLIAALYQTSTLFIILEYAHLHVVIYIMYFLTYISSIIESAKKLHIIDEKIAEKLLFLFNIDDFIKKWKNDKR